MAISPYWLRRLGIILSDAYPRVVVNPQRPPNDLQMVSEQLDAVAGSMGVDFRGGAGVYLRPFYLGALSLITQKSTNNFSTRGGLLPTVVVCHYTASNKASHAISWFQNPSSQVSAHYVIDRNGDITQLVTIDYAAWHCGRSSWWHEGKLRPGVNRYSIGIEFVNVGPMVRSFDGSFWYETGLNEKQFRGPIKPVQASMILDGVPELKTWWEPFPKEQIDAGAWLVETLQGHVRDRWGVELDVVGHNEIARPLGRKLDPGPLFDWDRFASFRKHGPPPIARILTDSAQSKDSAKV